jgi:3-dehydroquinate synthase
VWERGETKPGEEKECPPKTLPARVPDHVTDLETRAMPDRQGADVPFVVPYVHRLRFTNDVLGEERGVLASLLESSDGRPARAQFWIDEHLTVVRPELVDRIHGFVDAFAGRVELAGNVQVVAGGEAVKNDIHVLERMLKVFNAANLDRRSYVVVIGGGALLDAVGFATAIAHRGLRLVRLPTTTLAQADSGVGVKNGVNLFGKKNWVGSFAPPWAVVNDLDLLSTLPHRDFVCGFSEAVKVSLLKDRAMFESLCASASRIRQRELSVAAPMIRSSCEWHLRHITQGGDPFEMLEARPLDFGHWSAHKLETMSDFRLRHGEAVAIGVAIDAVYSSLVHGFPASDAERVLDCLTELGLGFDNPSLLDTETLFDGLEEFRQHLGGRLTLTMLRAVGDPIDVHEVDADKMREAIQTVRHWRTAPTPNRRRIRLSEPATR